jgi:hypothetical protein
MGKREGLSEEGLSGICCRRDLRRHVPVFGRCEPDHVSIAHKRVASFQVLSSAPMGAAIVDELRLRGQVLPLARATSFEFRAGRTSGAPKVRRIFFDVRAMRAVGWSGRFYPQDFCLTRFLDANRFPLRSKTL